MLLTNNLKTLLSFQLKEDDLRQLRKLSCSTWNDVKNNCEAILRQIPQRGQFIVNKINTLIHQVKQKNYQYFVSRLNSKYYIALLDLYPNRVYMTAFRQQNKVVCATLYHNETITYYLQGRNMDKLAQDIRKYSVIVVDDIKDSDIGKQLRESEATYVMNLSYHLSAYNLTNTVKTIITETSGVNNINRQSIYQKLWNLHKQKHSWALSTMLALQAERVVNLSEKLIILTQAYCKCVSSSVSSFYDELLNKQHSINTKVLKAYFHPSCPLLKQIIQKEKQNMANNKKELVFSDCSGYFQDRFGYSRGPFFRFV